MKEEYQEKFEKMDNFFETYMNYPNTQSACEAYRAIFLPRMKELAATKDTQVLERLIGYFDEDFDREIDYVASDLIDEIRDNFSHDQIIEALYGTINDFANKHIRKCASICMWFLWGRLGDQDKFRSFRRMFWKTRPQRADELLDRMAMINSDYIRRVDVLRNDVKKWRKEEADKAVSDMKIETFPPATAINGMPLGTSVLVAHFANGMKCLLLSPNNGK